MQISPSKCLLSKLGEATCSKLSYENEHGSSLGSSHHSPAEHLTFVSPRISPASGSVTGLCNQSPTALSNTYDFGSPGSMYFTPSSNGNGPLSPIPGVSPAIDLPELPLAQSGPASPFNFPGRLVGFSEPAESPSQSSNMPIRNVDARFPPASSSLLFQPHYSPGRTTTITGPQFAFRQISSSSHSNSSPLRDPVRHDPTPMDDTDTICLLSQVQSLGDEAMSKYQKLSAHEVDQPSF